LEEEVAQDANGFWWIVYPCEVFGAIAVAIDVCRSGFVEYIRVEKTKDLFATSSNPSPTKNE